MQTGNQIHEWIFVHPEHNFQHFELKHLEHKQHNPEAMFLPVLLTKYLPLR